MRHASDRVVVECVAVRTQRIAPIALAVVALAALASPAAALEPDARYALVHGCYALQSGGKTVAADAGPFRMQATGLGTYLLYGKRGDYLSAGLLGDAVAPASEPSERSDWKVEVRGDAFTLTLADGRALTAGPTAP